MAPSFELSQQLSSLRDMDIPSDRMWQGFLTLAFIGIFALLLRGFVDSRLVKMQQSLIATMYEYMQDADASRQNFRAHLESLLEQHASATLTPGAAESLLDDTRSRLSSRLGNTAGEVIDRFLQMGPEYLKNNLVHGNSICLASPTQPG